MTEYQVRDCAATATMISPASEDAGPGDALATALGVDVEKATRWLGQLGGSTVALWAGEGAWRSVGATPSQARRATAACAFARAVAEARRQVRPVMRGPRDIADLMRGQLAALECEELWLIALDARNGVRGTRMVARGGAVGCAVVARDVLRAAILDGAVGFVLVHAHPSGDPSPSREDVTLTQAIAAAGRACGVPLCDHVVIGRGGAHVSLFEQGLVDP